MIQLYGQEFITNLNKKRIGADKYPLVRNFRTWALSDCVLEQMETGDPYPIKGLWLYTNNFIAGTAQDPKRHYEAARNLDFNVVVDNFMTPTASAIADIVLPGNTFAEKDAVFSTGVVLNAMHRAIKVGDTKSGWDIAFEMAKRLNPQSVPWNDLDELFTERLRPAGVTFKELSQKSGLQTPADHASGGAPYHRHEKGQLRPDGEPGFRTPTGKIELYSTLFEEYGLDPLPFHREPVESPISTPVIFEDFPLILITGRRILF